MVKHTTTKNPILAFALPLAILAFGCGPVYYFYGFNFFLPLEMKMLGLSSQEWNSILQDKTMLILGGHHRGGTTLLWEMLKLHPEVSNFGTTFETGSDFSEGVFLQDVLPMFGIGSEGLQSTTGNTRIENKGLGQYALAPEAEVHWTEENHREAVTLSNRDRVLNQWGYYWKANDGFKQEKKVWMEKSPTNAVVSRYIQALFDLGLVTGGLRRSRSKFVFLMRDPIANAYAHRAGFAGCKGLSLDVLMNNWLRIANYVTSDVRDGHLQYAKILTLEELTEHPQRVYTELLTFLDLRVEQDVVDRAVAMVKANPNDKYKAKFCRDVFRGGLDAGRAQFEAFHDKFGDAVKEYGYHLEEYFNACPQLTERVREETTAAAGPPGKESNEPDL